MCTIACYLIFIIRTLCTCFPLTRGSLEYNRSSHPAGVVGSSASTSAFKGAYCALGNWYARVRCSDLTCGSRLIAVGMNLVNKKVKIVFRFVEHPCDMKIT